MIGILAGAIPLLTKGVQEIFKSKQRKREDDFQLKKIEIEAEARAKVAGIVANADAIKAEQEAKKQEWEFEKERQKTLAEIAKNKTGIKWVDASVELVRALFGYGAVSVFLMSAVNLWQSGSFLLSQEQFAQTFFMIISYFLAERSAKKAWKNK